MKTVLTILAAVLSTQTVLAASATQAPKNKAIACVMNESTDGQNFKAVGEPKRLELTNGQTLMLTSSNENIKGYVQMGADNRYTLSIVALSNGVYEALAFSMASTLEPAVLISFQNKVGLSCSQAIAY